MIFLGVLNYFKHSFCFKNVTQTKFAEVLCDNWNLISVQDTSFGHIFLPVPEQAMLTVIY